MTESYEKFMKAVEVFEELGFIEEPREVAHNYFADTLCDTIYWNILYEMFMHEMPYGTAKARTGDPDTWIMDKLANLIEG